MRNGFADFTTFIFCVAAVLGASAPVGASEPADSVALGQVTVTARGNREVTSAAPLYTVDAKAYGSMGVTGVGDLLNRLPGVTLKDYGGAGGLKTVSVRGLGAAHTNVIYDGVALTDSRSGEIDLSRYSLDDISAVGLAVGDNDDILLPARSAAMAATLMLSAGHGATIEADSTMLSTRVRGGSFGLINPYLKAGRAWKSGTVADITAEYLHADNDYPFRLKNGQHTSNVRRENSRMNSWHGEANVRTSLSARTSLTAKAYWYDNSRRLPGPVVLYNNVSNEAMRERNAFVQASVRSVLSEKWSLLGNAKWNWSASAYSDRDGKYPGGELHQDYWQREWYGSAAALWMPTEAWSMTYAADYAYNSLNSNQKEDVGPSRNTVLQALTARFRSGTLTVTARGLLSTIINSAKCGDKGADVTRLSPSVSVAYGLGPINLRASYKNIFRAPTFNELYFYRIGSNDLRPESTDQFNAGVTGALGTGNVNITFTADGYLNHVRDKIVAIPYNMVMWRMVNLNSVRSVGADITFGATWHAAAKHTMLLEGNYSLLACTTRGDHTVSEYGKQVAYTPRHSGSGSVAWENPWVNVSVHATAVSARWATNNHAAGSRIAGYVDAGAAIYRAFPLGRHSLEARADLINVFNTQYEVIARYPMPGRAWQASLKFTL